MAEREPKAGCFIAVVDGVVKGAAAADDPKIIRKAVAEWMRQEPLPDVIRVPVKVARQFLFEPWPGLEAALAHSPTA